MNAETKASEIVATARQGRGTRLKQAKSEAQSSIDAYRSQKQSQFDSATLTLGADRTGTGEDLRRETERDVKEMERKVSRVLSSRVEQRTEDEEWRNGAPRFFPSWI